MAKENFCVMILNVAYHLVG